MSDAAASGTPRRPDLSYTPKTDAQLDAEAVITDADTESAGRFARRHFPASPTDWRTLISGPEIRKPNADPAPQNDGP